MCLGADETMYTMGAGSRVNKADAKADTLVAWPYPETILGETSSQERVTGPPYRVQNSSMPALVAWLDRKERLVEKRSTTTSHEQQGIGCDGDRENPTKVTKPSSVKSNGHQLLYTP